MSMVDERTDILEELDQTIPCQGLSHLEGIEGHEPDEPAAYMVVCPECGPRAALCRGRVEFLQVFNTRIRCSGCNKVNRFNKWGKEPL